MGNPCARWAFRTGALVAIAVALGAGAEVSEEDELVAMDLEALMDIEVTTVSKRAQKVSETPAAVFVISQEDIRRSGVTNVPDALRLAPGVHVAQIDANRWAISARGFNDEYSNKLLVMIDGRSIYTPLFSGVIWNEQDLMLEDIDRIEVVRGPGGTVWGANAVNGVIHIITKSAKDTQGLLVSSLSGNKETFTGAARWGGALGDNLHYRVYGKFAERDGFPANGMTEAHDGSRNIRAGGRVDWEATESDLVTFQGDFMDGGADRTVADALIEDRDDYRGGNVLARASHSFSDTADLTLQANYEGTQRENLFLSEDRDTVDVDLQHSFVPFARNHVVWGGGYRFTSDHLKEAVPAITVDDDRQIDNLFSLFVQDEIAVVKELLSFTVGSKFEHNDYTGYEIQPSARVLATPHDRHTVWASVSRAVHTPSRADEDINSIQVLGPTTFATINGSNSFDSEEVLAYELGYRTRPIDALTLDLATFYNQYDDLRSLDTVSVTTLGPTTFIDITNRNNMSGHGYGAELAAQWIATDFLYFTGEYTFTRNDLHFKDGGVDAFSLLANGENLTPLHQFRIGSHVNLPWNFQFDAALGWVDGLNQTDVDAYTRLDLRLGWRVNPNLEVSLVGQNLIEKHQEFPNSFQTESSEVPRSFYGAVRWLW